jgi:spermidine synthase
MISIEVPSIYLGRQVRYFSTEFFSQIAEHLTEGGLVSYQLPMSELSAEAFSSVLKGFCETFSNCSLWYVNDTTLMALGGTYSQKSTEELNALWQTPAFVSSAPYGIAEQPAVLASHYVADGAVLANALQDVTALSDDDWARDPRQRLERVPHQFLSYIDPDKSRERLQESTTMLEVLPSAVVRKAGYFFLYRPYIDDLLMSPVLEPQARFSFEPLSFLLGHTKLVALPRLLLHSDSRKLRVLSQKKREASKAGAHEVSPKENAVALAFEGIEALVQRDYRRAAALFTEAIASDDSYDFLYNYRIFALCMASKSDERDPGRKEKFAKALRVGMEVAQGALAPSNFNEEFWSWAGSCSAV